jgi:hypothetical protein
MSFASHGTSGWAPSSDVLSLVDPWLSHSLHDIGSFRRSVPWRILSAQQLETKQRQAGYRKTQYNCKPLIHNHFQLDALTG